MATAYDPSETLSTLVRIALEEDLSDKGDVTSQALIDQSAHGTIAIVSRKSGVLSGTQAASLTLSSVDPSLAVEWKVNDGQHLESGTHIAHITGNLRSILVGERTTLNFLQHLSGIATLTAQYVRIVAEQDSRTIVRDTRKTLPGYRALEKQAVVDGGGHNHRYGLYDAFLVKDNHLMGRDLEIVAQRCREFDPRLPLEIEVDSLSQLNVVLRFKPDVILLDNFSVDDVYRATEIAPDTDLEISGGVNMSNIAEYAKTNVAYIAIGALTHSAPALDIGFDAL